MDRRRLRTSAYKARLRERFWVEHGEKVRMAFIGGGIVTVATAIASVALR
jgi:hypothetical protein